jgi:hypothetical protein
MAGPKVDEIGPWSKVKLDILKRYAVEYSKILSRQRNPQFFHVYIDPDRPSCLSFAQAILNSFPSSSLVQLAT